jgi:hypothetical protein
VERERRKREEKTNNVWLERMRGPWGVYIRLLGSHLASIRKIQH